MATKDTYSGSSIYSAGINDDVMLAQEQDLARSISGPNLVATIYLPGFGLRVFAELMTISYQLYGELAPVPVNGSRSIAGIARGPIWVAGSMVFVYFDRHALLDILDYAQGNPSDYMATMQALLQQGRWVDLLRKLEWIRFRQDYIDNPQNHGVQPVVTFDEQQKNMITDMDKASQGDLTKFQSLYFGDTTGAGSASLDAKAKTIRQEIDEMQRGYTLALQKLRDRQNNPGEWDKKFRRKMSALHLPPFNVQLFGMNESGVAVKAGIYGIHIQTDGATFSIEDLITEGVCQYQAMYVESMNNLMTPESMTQKHSLSSIQDQVETISTELWRRMQILNQAKNDTATSTPVDAWRAATSPTPQADTITASPVQDLALVFDPAPVVSVEGDNAVLTWPAQEQFNRPPITHDFDTGTWQAGVRHYTAYVTAGSSPSAAALPRAAQTFNVMNLENVATKSYGIEIPATLEPDGTYTLAIDKEMLMSLARGTCPTIEQSGKWHVQIFFRAAFVAKETPTQMKVYDQAALPNGWQSFEGYSNSRQVIINQWW